MGILRSFVLFVTNPKLFFQSIENENGYKKMILYFTVFLLIGSIIRVILRIISSNEIDFLSLAYFPIAFVVGLSILYVIFSFYAMTIHGLVRIFGGSKNIGFTIKIVLYVYGTMALLPTNTQIPIVDNISLLVLVFIPLVFISYGIHLIHRLAIWKSLLATLFPIILGSICMILLLIAFIGSFTSIEWIQ